MKKIFTVGKPPYYQEELIEIINTNGDYYFNKFNNNCNLVLYNKHLKNIEEIKWMKKKGIKCQTYENYIKKIIRGNKKLLSSQKKVLTYIESQINEKIPQFLAIKRNSTCYTSKNGKITFLSIQRKKIDHLPLSISELDSLKGLFLNKNQLKSLPDSIGLLKNLEILWIWYNNLTSLPRQFDGLTNLKEISIRNNPLKIFPEEINSLQNLVKLTFESCSIRKIPKNIQNLKFGIQIYAK